MPTGVRMPGMNSLIERWVKTLRAELLDRALIWNHAYCAERFGGTSRCVTSGGLNIM
ncbi:hypothetical protein ACWEIJ_36325 [Lentzea sp. NPDC004789]